MNDYKFVCYLYTIFDERKTLINFVNHYKKYKPGLNHKLVICFKLFSLNEVIELRKYLKDINYIEFIDPGKNNDWDFGSYRRVSKFFYDKDILFLSSHSYPVSSNWLKKLFLFKKKKYCCCSNCFI